MEMNMGKLEWNPEDGEGFVLFSTKFITSDRIVQLDALVDWIRMLQDTYDEMLEQTQGVNDEQS
jgi:hypothetical protein